MLKINIEIDNKYREALDLLKQVIPNFKGEEITEDSEMVEALIDSFMAFIQEQAGEGEWHEHNHSEEGGSCGTGWCGCSH